MESCKGITDLYLQEMEAILEFRALTQFAYLQFDRSANNGLKVKVQLRPTSKNLNTEEVNTKMKDYEKGFLPQLSFQNSVSIFESWFFDILRLILKDKNRLNKKKKIDVSAIIECASIEEVVMKIVDVELNELKYQKPADWFDYLNKFVNITGPSEDEILEISEIKASRDIIVHNDGVCNEIYIGKSFTKSRGVIGTPLCFDHDYVFSSWTFLNTVMENVGKELSEKIDA